MSSSKYQSFYPLPGGIENFVVWLNNALAFIRDNKPTEEQLTKWFFNTFPDVKKERNVRSYINTTLKHSGLVVINRTGIILSEDGKKYLEHPNNKLLFQILDNNVLGFSETVLLLGRKPHNLDELHKALIKELETYRVEWTAAHGQPYWRVNWLRSMGFVAFHGHVFCLTDAGQELLAELGGSIIKEPKEQHLAAAQYFYDIAKELQYKGMFDEAETQFLKAINYCEKAAKIEPKMKDVWEKMGDIYKDSSRFESAIKPYLKALALDPKNTVLLRKLIGAYSLAAMHEVTLASTKKEYYLESIRLLHKYLRVYPSDTSALITLGDAHHYLGDYEEAQFHYDKVLELQPTYSEALEKAVENLLSMRNYEKALELLERDCKARPDSHIPLLHLANFYEEAGDFQRAIDYMKKAIEKEPNIPELWEHLQDYYAHTGNYGSAEECRNKALEIRSVRRNR
jgi:tetratricopeptide (TPR) repeat protein